MMRKVLTFLVAALMLSTVAFAQNANNRVYLDSRSVGDSLVFPFYMAVDGVSTDFEVINTSNEYSVVAKVVVRSQMYSQELRDFLIYLSPNDVTRISLTYSNGSVYVSSSDDSVCLGSVSSETFVCGDFNYELVTPKCDDTNTIGYVEVIQAAAFDRATLGVASGPIEKEMIAAQYEGMVTFDDEDTQNVITGFAEVNVPGAETIAYNATALSELNNQIPLTISNETSIVTTGFNNEWVETESALTKTEYYLPYYNAATYAIINFPTKNTIYDGCEDYTSLSPFFSDTYAPIYDINYYDMEENSYQEGCLVSPCNPEETLTLPYEVNILTLNSGQLNADMGFARLEFAAYSTSDYSIDRDNVTYTGVPSIGLMLQFTADGAYFLPAPFDYGTVTYNNVAELPYAE